MTVAELRVQLEDAPDDLEVVVAIVIQKPHPPNVVIEGNAYQATVDVGDDEDQRVFVVNAMVKS